MFVRLSLAYLSLEEGIYKLYKMYNNCDILKYGTVIFACY